MEKIGIAEVLLNIRQMDEFSFVMVRATKSIGTLKVVNRAVHGFNYKQFKVKQRQEYSITQERARHKERGTIPIIDLEADQQLTPLISHIIFFEGKKVIH